MHTVPLDHSNLGECAWIAVEAYAPDPLMGKWLRPYPSTHDDHNCASFVQWIKGFVHSPNNYLRAVVSDSDDEFYDEASGPEVIGFAMWERRFGAREREKIHPSNGDHVDWSTSSTYDKFERWALGWQTSYSNWLRVDPAVDWNRRSSFFADMATTGNHMHNLLKEHSHTGGYVWLNDLCTAPKYQRRGIGSVLLQEGIEKAKAEDVPIGLTATARGASLYKRFGIQNVGRMVVGGIEIQAMIWWPSDAAMIRPFEVQNGELSE